jgi:hypothetical protein
MLAFLLFVAMQPTLVFLLLVAMVTNSTGVVSVSMEIFEYGCLVTTAFSQTRPIMILTVLLRPFKQTSLKICHGHAHIF